MLGSVIYGDQNGGQIWGHHSVDNVYVGITVYDKPVWISGRWESKWGTNTGGSQCIISEMSGSQYRTSMWGSVQGK